MRLIAEVQQRVARAFHLSRAELLSRTRRRPVAAARQVAMYLCRDLAHTRAVDGGVRGQRRSWASFPRIGLAFARDHSSVMHACKVVARRQASDQGFAQMVEKLARGLRDGRPLEAGGEV